MRSETSFPGRGTMFWRRETRSQGSGYAFPGWKNTFPSVSKRPPTGRKHVSRVGERVPRFSETPSQHYETSSQGRGTRSQVSRNTVMMSRNNVMMSRNTFPGCGCDSRSDKDIRRGNRDDKVLGAHTCHNNFDVRSNRLTNPPGARCCRLRVLLARPYGPIRLCRDS